MNMFNYRTFHNYYFISREYLHECIIEKKKLCLVAITQPVTDQWAR